MSLRCGANCLECSIELQKIRGWSCRFKELYYSPGRLALERRAEFELKHQSNNNKKTEGKTQ